MPCDLGPRRAAAETHRGGFQTCGHVFSGMAEDAKEEKYFDRYEVVAVALPGAALILTTWYLDPGVFGTAKFDLEKVSIGGFGLFAIASMIAGQLVQGVSNLAEFVLNAGADRFGSSPMAKLPDHERYRVLDALRAVGVPKPEAADRERFRREMHKTILRLSRKRGTSRMSDVFNVTYGLNRGLAISSALGALNAGIERRWLPLFVLTAIFATTALRAYRASLRFEHDMLLEFADVALDQASPA